MSDQGEEGQVPAPPGLEGRGELPPRPTVRESFRRGLFVRLPTEGEAGEGLPGLTQGAPNQPAEETDYSGQTHAELYTEQVADPYPGWRQAADGSWEAVTPESYDYSQGSEPAAPEAYPEIDQSANFASVAGGEPFIHQETGTEEAPLAEMPPAPEAAPEVAPFFEIAPEVAPATEMPPAPEAAAEVVPVAEVVPEAVLVPEVVPEAAANAEATPAAEDPVAGAGLYIPGDIELLEGDMPLYGENEKVPPRFAGEGLGEPIFIEFGDLPQSLVGLRRLLPKGTRLAYNYDHERAWVRTSADIDLPYFAERVKALEAEGEEASA